MRVAATIDELFAGGGEPRCFLARRFLFWAADEHIGGHAVWGCADRSDAEGVVRVLERGIAAGDRTPGRLVIDFGELVSVEADAFDVVARYFARHRGAIAADGVIVRPGGALGAMVAGFYDVVGHQRMPVVTTVADACARLERPDAASVAAKAYRLRDQRGGAHDTVDRLRALLAATPPPESLDAAARALRMSRRTLQHRLRVRSGATGGGATVGALQESSPARTAWSDRSRNELRRLAAGRAGGRATRTTRRRVPPRPPRAAAPWGRRASRAPADAAASGRPAR